MAEADWEQLRAMLTSVLSPLLSPGKLSGVVETLLCNLTSYASWFVCFETGSNSRLSWNSLHSPGYNSTLVLSVLGLELLVLISSKGFIYGKASYILYRYTCVVRKGFV